MERTDDRGDGPRLGGGGGGVEHRGDFFGVNHLEFGVSKRSLENQRSRGRTTAKTTAKESIIYPPGAQSLDWTRFAPSLGHLGALRKLSGYNDVITGLVRPLIPAMIRVELSTGPSAPGSRHHTVGLLHSHSTVVKNIGPFDASPCPMAAPARWDGLVRRGRESGVRSRESDAERGVAKNISRLQPRRFHFRRYLTR